MKPRQQLGKPCKCGECRQAGVSDRPSVIDTRTGKIAFHGYDLKAWHEARETFLEAFRRAAGVPRETP